MDFCQSQVFQYNGRKVFEFQNDTKEKKITITSYEVIIEGVPLATELGIGDNATKFEKEYVRCVRNEKECVCSAPNCCDTKQGSARQW